MKYQCRSCNGTFESNRDWEISCEVCGRSDLEPRLLENGTTELIGEPDGERAVSDVSETVHEEAQIDLELSDCPRPKSVTVMSWIDIVLAIVGLAFVFVLAMIIKFRASGMPLIFACAMGGVLQCLWGWGMLNGKNWARLLFLWFVPVTFVIVLLAGRPNPVTFFHIVRYIIFAALLTRPNAVVYFTRTASRGPSFQP